MESARDDREQFSRRGVMQAGIATASLLALGALAAGSDAVRADAPAVSVERETVTLAAAQALIAAGMAKAQEIGVLKAMVRMDGNSLASVDLVQQKAYTASAFRAPTHILAQRFGADPVRLASVTNSPRFTLLGGGYPIMHGNAVVGGVGAGGGSPEQDQMVAEAALASLA
jgi:uncharacterized protein GlcG (DUF336 family)